DTHVAKGTDNAVDGFRVNEVIGKMVVDFAISEVAAILAELNQHFEPIAARFLFFGCELTACRDVFIALTTLAAALRQRLQLRDDFAISDVVIDKIIVVNVGILGWTAGTTAGRLRGTRSGTRCLLGSSFLRCRLFSCRLLRCCLFSSSFLGGSLLRSGLLGGGRLGRGRIACGVFPSLYCERIGIARRR